MKIRMLLSTQRSGSHFLKALTEANFRNVTCSAEVIEPPQPHIRQAPSLPDHPGFPLFWPWLDREIAAGRFSRQSGNRLDAFEHYLRELSALVPAKDILVDVKYNSTRVLTCCGENHFVSREFISFLQTHHIPVLHLIRRNILKIIISYKLAVESKIWHCGQVRNPGDATPKITLQPKGTLLEIRYGLNLIREHQAALAGCDNSKEVVYEELVDEEESRTPGPNFNAIAQVLGRPPVVASQPQTRFHKTTPDDPSEVVENWDQIVRLLRGTEHAWMTEPALVLA